MEERRLIELLQVLPPAPESWVAAARNLAGADGPGALAAPFEEHEPESAWEDWSQNDSSFDDPHAGADPAAFDEGTES